MKKVKEKKISTPKIVKTKLKFPLLIFILGLFLVFAVHQFSFVKPHVTLEKALAVKKTKGLSLIPTFTPTPTIKLIFNSRDLLEATPTATPATKSANIQSGFCLYVPILIYHHTQPLDEAKVQGHASLTVDSGIFDSQMSYLVANGYHTISSDQVVNALINHQQLPAKSIVVTLDDGYDDAYNYAFQIAKKYNVSMDFMIPSGLINNPGYMSWGQLKEMAGNNLVHIYNHTWSHASLGAADRTKIEFEINTSQNELQSQLGKSINIFTYPYGSFSPLAIQILKEHGFIGGISTINGTMQCDSYVMTLHRTHIGNAPLSSYGF